MAQRISVYVDPETHRALKTAAGRSGLTLSEFVLRAALRDLNRPKRELAARHMDQVREAISGTFTEQDVRTMREEGHAC